MLFKLEPFFSKLEFNLKESIYYKTFHSFSKIQWNYYLSQKRLMHENPETKINLNSKFWKWKSLTKSRVAIDPKYIPRWQTLLSTPLKHLKDLFLFVFISFFGKTKTTTTFLHRVFNLHHLCVLFSVFLSLLRKIKLLCV